MTIPGNKKNSLAIGFLILSFIAVAGSCTLSNKVTKSERYALIEPMLYADEISKRYEVNLIDVRTQAEYNQGHLPNAININFLGKGFKNKVKKLDPTIPVYIYCQTAHRSPFAAKQMYKLGFKKVHDLKGGFSNWKKSGLEIKLPDS